MQYISLVQQADFDGLDINMISALTMDPSECVQFSFYN
jgi:hypothetical protein